MTECPTLGMISEGLDRLSRLTLGVPGDEFLNRYQSGQIVIIDPKSSINYLAYIADVIAEGPNLHVVKDDDNPSK